jgi:hypothetical protein
MARTTRSAFLLTALRHLIISHASIFN